MQTSKNKRAYALSYSALVALLFILTAWRAVDDLGKDFRIEDQPLIGESEVCPGKSNLQWLERKFGGVVVPARQDIGRMFFQPTITNATFPAVGDKLRTAFDQTSPGIVATPPGGPQNWDFTNISADVHKVVVFQTASDGSAFSSFPTADLVTIDGSGTENYYAITPTQFLLLGRSGFNLEGNIPVNLKLIYNPPLVERRAPLNFFDASQSSTGNLAPFAPSDLPPGYLSSLPVMPDSLRLRIAINRLDVVDAYGYLSIPQYTSEVLRQKSTTYKESRLDGKIPSIGWMDITDLATQFLGADLGVDTTVTFSFYSNASKEPVAVIYTDATQLLAQSVEFKDLDPACLHVTSTLNTGLGSLREAVFCSIAGDTIRFEPSVFNQIISLDLPVINTGHPLTLFSDPSQNITISNFNAGNSGVLLNIQDQLNIFGLKIIGQTPESMIFNLGAMGQLNLVNSEINKLTLNKN